MSSCILQDAFGGAMVNVDMLSETTLTLTDPAFTNLILKVTPLPESMQTRGTYDMTFGFHPDATDGFDPFIDDYAPPPPPPPSFDAALGWIGERYYNQIIASNINEITMDVLLQFPEDNIITITWDNTGWSRKR